MTRRRAIKWVCFATAAVALAGLLYLGLRAHRPQLPALARYPGMPEAFDRALRRAREKAGSGPDIGAARDLAHLYQANRLYPEARACFLALAASPGGLTARDHYYLAAIDQDEGDLGAAQSELRATLREDPIYIPARIALADVLLKSGQPDQAEREYGEVLAAEPDLAQASYGLARIELQRGNDEGAIARLKRLVARHPESTSAEALLAQILDRRGDADGAGALRAMSQQTHEPVPPDPWMKALLADCYDRQQLALAFEQYRLAGQMDEALPLMDRLEELSPKSWIPPMLRGWSNKEAGHYPEAVQQYQLSLNYGGDPETIVPLLVNALLTEKKAAAAAELLAGYRARMPHSVPILLSYSEVAVRMGNETLARSLLTEVLTAEPYLYMPNMSLVQILWNAGEHEEAVTCLKRVARVFPSDIDSRGLIGQYYMEKSDALSAIEPLEEAVAAARPGDPRRDRVMKMLNTAYLVAGSVAAASGDFAGALRLSEKSIALMPAGMRGYTLKAKACLRLRDYKGAAQALGKMASLQPAEPNLQLYLGDAVYLGGDAQGARRHWQRALELAPQDASELRDAVQLRISGHVPADAFQ
jgi:tetratricopeptide (TPR) repeat protein